MKDYIKIAISGIVILVLTAIPPTCAYYVWSWVMGLVPAATEWTGLIKIGVTIAMFLVDGGFTIAATFFAFGAGAFIAESILD